MKKNMAYMMRKTITLFLLFSVIALLCISFLPWVSVKNTDETHELFLNKAMIENSNNPGINMLSKDLNMVYVMLWCIVIFGMLSYVGLNIMLVKKYEPIGISFLLTGCLTVLFNSADIVYYVFLIQNIPDIENVSLAFIFKPLFFNYAYISLIFVVFSLYYSIKYVYFVAPYSIKYFSSFKKSLGKKEKEEETKVSADKTKNKEREHWWRKRKEKKEIEMGDNEPSQMEKHLRDIKGVKKDVTPTASTLDKSVDRERLELEKWLASESGILGEIENKKNIVEKKETMKAESSVESTSTVEAEMKSRVSGTVDETGGGSIEEKKEEIEKEEKKEFSVSTSEDSTSSSTDKSFDEVLTSAIEKRQKTPSGVESEKPIQQDTDAIGAIGDEEKLQEKLDEIKERILKESVSESKPSYEDSMIGEEVGKPVKEEPLSNVGFSKVKKVKVRCPRCKHVFTTEIDISSDGGFRVKCPNCGKEGTAK